MLIYCVEDEDNIRELLVYTLRANSFKAKGFSCGKGFFAMLEEEVPDLILLDIMLSGKDGMTILKELRGKEKTKEIPVILLTAKSSEIDKIVGLDLGADDYITKPFSMQELISRIRAVLRRVNKQADNNNMLVNRNLVVDQEKHLVFIDTIKIELTLKEYDLLVYLMNNQGIALYRDKILCEVWGYDVDSETRTVDVHIQTLRQKLSKYTGEIQTVRGIGYRMEA